MILQTGSMAQVLDHMPSKFESLTLNPVCPRERKDLLYPHLTLFSTLSLLDLYFQPHFPSLQKLIAIFAFLMYM
jgi:hypothetical protein